MKKLMIAASVVAIGAAAFADVYSVKFTATTAIDAVRKVKGEEISYFKKSSVAINGFYDKDNGKYYFWTGTGKNMAPVQNAVFEFANETDLDSSVNGKNYAANVGLYVGNAEGEVESYFISGGFGTVKTVATDDLNSMNGSFGGTWNGFPAYGTWSMSRNAAATKDLAGTIAKQGKQAGLTIESWTTDAKAPTPILSSLKTQAAEIAEALAEIEALTSTTNANAETIAALNAQIAADEAAIASNETAIAALDETVATNAAVIAELTAENEKLAADAAKVATLLAQLNNKDELSGELLDDFLSGVTNTQKAAYIEATNMVETLKAALKKYQDLGVTAVYTNEVGEVTNATLSAEAVAKLEQNVVATSNANAAAEAAWDAKWDEYDAASDLLDYYTALQAAGDNYENFVLDRSNLIQNVLADYADATNWDATIWANYSNDVNVANLDYTNTIDAIKGNYETVVKGLTGLTNTLATVDLVETNALLDAALADYADATNSLAVYPDFNTWEIDFGGGYGSENQKKIAYQDFRADQEKTLADATKAVDGLKADVAAIEKRIANLAGVLDQVVKAGKDDPAKWVGKAKELAEAALATNALEIAEAAAARDEALANNEEYKKDLMDDVARLQKQIDEGKGEKISVADVEAQSALVQFIYTNDLPKAEAAYDKTWDDYAAAMDALEDSWFSVYAAAETLKVLVDKYPYETGFDEAYEALLKKWEDLAAEAKRNLDAAQKLLDRDAS